MLDGPCEVMRRLIGVAADYAELRGKVIMDEGFYDYQGRYRDRGSSQVNGNTTSGSAGGILNHAGTLTLNASQVNGNTAAGACGGGILNHGAMTINLSQVDNNATPADSPGGQGGGGGIANLNITPLTGAPDSGVLTVNLSQVRNNSAGGLGGGILEDGVNPGDSLGPAGGPLTLKLSQVTGNTAAEGGGIYASSGSPVA